MFYLYFKNGLENGQHLFEAEKDRLVIISAAVLRLVEEHFTSSPHILVFFLKVIPLVNLTQYF